jgi:hypothetical protein
VLLLIEYVARAAPRVSIVARVANNSEEPRSTIAAGECPKVPQGSQASVLHDILCIVLVRDEPSCQSVRGVEVWQDDLVKTAGASSGVE